MKKNSRLYYFTMDVESRLMVPAINVRVHIFALCKKWSMCTIAVYALAIDTDSLSARKSGPGLAHATALDRSGRVRTPAKHSCKWDQHNKRSGGNKKEDGKCHWKNFFYLKISEILEKRFSAEFMRRRAQQFLLPRANKEGKYFSSVDDDNKRSEK